MAEIGKAEIDQMNALMGGEGANSDPVQDLQKAFEGSEADKPAAKKTKHQLTPEQLANAEYINTTKNRVTKITDDRHDSSQGQLQLAFTKYARLCGFLTDNGTKVDFSLSGKSQKNDDQTMSDAIFTLKLVNSAPTAPKFYIILAPTSIKSALIQKLEDGLKIEELVQNPGSFHVDYVPKDEIDEYLTRFTSGILYEAEETFTPFIKKSGTAVTSYTKYNDCKQYPVYSMEFKYPAIFRQAAISKSGQVSVTVKHTFRSRLLQPNNYISKTEFETVPMPSTLTKEEADIFTSLYLAKFATPKNDATKICRLKNLNTDQQKHFSVVSEGNGNKIASNDVFTPDASRSILSSFQVADWYEKDVSGNPVIKSADKVRLARKILKENAKSPSYIKKELQPADAADPAGYKFNEKWPVVRASHGGITFTDVKKNFAKRVASKSTPRQQTAKLGGAQLMGMSQEEFKALVEASRSK